MLAALPLIVPIGVFTTLWAIAEIHGRITVVCLDSSNDALVPHSRAIRERRAALLPVRRGNIGRGTN
jgi:hypothetical protein